ncbi:hypothetical protein ACFWRV_19950 [Streptomyces sp. NPDC058576]|uniref:hypothetical protein n=1 Tax=Streptomyces sp. NPDC058576 TaxID=3346547 RepID=UPI00365BDB91
MRDSSAVDATGHRIVHDGPHLLRATVIDEDARAELDRAADLAPLYVPRRRPPWTRLGPCCPMCRTSYAWTPPSTPASRPPPAPLPRAWTERHRLRRYRFHGLSYAEALRRTAEVLGRPAGSLHVVLAYLRGGCSGSAVREVRSVDTTMGFAPLEGLVTSKRSGSVERGRLLWLQTSTGMTVERIEDVLNHESGLFGLSGTSGDTRGPRPGQGPRGTAKRPSPSTCSR